MNIGSRSPRARCRDRDKRRTPSIGVLFRLVWLRIDLVEMSFIPSAFVKDIG